MTLDNTASIDSKVTEHSHGWEEVSKLGQEIVNQLGDSHKFDLLSCWMAHHIAELIDGAKTASSKDKAAMEQKCADLILRVWDKRSNWPYGTPVERALALLEIIDPSEHTDKGNSHSEWQTNSSGDLFDSTAGTSGADRNSEEVAEDTHLKATHSEFWLSLSARLDTLGERERTVVRNAALALLPRGIVDNLEQWLGLEGYLADDESRILRHLKSLIEKNQGDTLKLDTMVVPVFQLLSRSRQARRLLLALNNISEERRILLAAVERKFVSKLSRPALGTRTIHRTRSLSSHGRRPRGNVPLKQVRNLHLRGRSF